MDIVHVASELAPIAKVGGLADVISGLSKALAKKGHRVTIILPKYDCLDYHLIEDLQVLQKNFPIEENGITIQNTLWSAKYDSLELILIEAHHPRAYFEREKIYGEEDDNDRFLFFCKVASTYLAKHPPKVVH
nr:Glycogen synthase [Chlamydiota bacterium]